MLNTQPYYYLVADIYTPIRNECISHTTSTHAMTWW
jgi:hypothetical protein